MRECYECGMDFASDEMTRYHGSVVCFGCYDILSYDDDDDDDDDFDDDDDDEDDEG